MKEREILVKRVESVQEEIEICDYKHQLEKQEQEHNTVDYLQDEAPYVMELREELRMKDEELQ